MTKLKHAARVVTAAIVSIVLLPFAAAVMAFGFLFGNVITAVVGDESTLEDHGLEMVGNIVACRLFPTYAHQIVGDGHRIRYYADGRVAIRLFATHHAEVADAAGRDGFLDVSLGGFDPAALHALRTDPTVAARCVEAAKRTWAAIKADREPSGAESDAT